MHRAARAIDLGPANAVVIRSADWSRPNDVVPIAVGVLGLDVELTEFFGGHFLANWIAATIEPGMDREPTAFGRVADEIDHGLVAAQRASTPVDRDCAKVVMHLGFTRGARDRCRSNRRGTSDVLWRENEPNTR